MWKPEEKIPLGYLGVYGRIILKSLKCDKKAWAVFGSR
jgi:hypothetical protein